MNRKSRSRKADGQVGPRIVRAWFDTVINPLLRALRDEQELLPAGNWTWRFEPGALEWIRPVRAFVDPEGSENLEQFLALYPDIRRAVDEHDKNVSLLTKESQELHRVIEESPDLHELYQRVASPESLADLRVDLKDLFGAYPPSRHLSLLAQYIVNRTRNLPNYYSTAPLWNRHKDRFLAILDRPPIRRQYQKTSTVGKDLLQNARHLAAMLEKLRLKLSLDHDVPYAVTGRRPESLA